METPDLPDPNELQHIDNNDEQSVPDPNGPPIPVNFPVSAGSWGIGSLLAIATGLVVTPWFLTAGRLSGATRTARIE